LSAASGQGSSLNAYLLPMDLTTIINAAPTPWWIALFAPVLTALIPVIVAGLFVTYYLTRKNTRWDLRHQVEFRADLASEMAIVAQSLRFESAVYRRKRLRGQFREGEQAKAKSALDETYVKCRTEGEAIELRLQVHFDPDKTAATTAQQSQPVHGGATLEEMSARQHWHAVMDLATVLYFSALMSDDNDVDVLDNLLMSNEGSEHSGLDMNRLKRWDDVTYAFRERLSQATGAVVRKSIAIPD